MRTERGSAPAFLLVFALLAVFAGVAYVLLSGDGPDAATDEVEAALAMTDEDATGPDADAEAAAETEREASAIEPLAEEPPAEESVDPDAIPPDATGLTGLIVDKSGAPAVDVEVTISRSVGKKDAAKFGVEIAPGKSTGRFERRVTTDEAGRFATIDLVAEKNYRIEIETAAGRIGRKDSVTVIAKLLRDIGEIPLRDGARVRGLVRTEGGSPVKEARVRFGWNWSQEQILTDAKGRFDAGVLFPGKHQIRVFADGYALPDNLQREFVEGDDVDDLVLVVVRAAPIRGRVVDAAGRGIPDAWINANRQGRTMFSWFSDQATSGPDGSFAFESIPAGEYDVNAGKGGYRYANVGDVVAGGAPIELKLEKAGMIQGVVVDARTATPIEAERISLYWVPPWRKNDPSAKLQKYHNDGNAECNEDGSFSIGLDDGGTFVAEAYADGYAPGRSERFELQQNGTVTGVIVRLEPGLALTVKAVDEETGAPIERAVLDVHVMKEGGARGDLASGMLHQLSYVGGANVVFDSPMGQSDGSGGPSIGERVARLLSDENGEAVCTSISPGSFAVIAKKHGYATAKVEGVTVVRGSSPPPVELSFTHGGAIEGRVSNDRGEPEPALHVYAMNADGRAGEGVSGEGGAYRIENLTPGRYAVEAENPDSPRGGNQQLFFGGGRGTGGNEPSEAEKYPLVIEEGRTATHDVVIERVVPGQLSGTVLVNGTPRADVQVMANFIDPEGGTSFSWGNAARTDESGNFRFRRLKPGSYDMLVHESWSEMYQGGKATVTPAAESLVTLDIGLGGISGTVVDADGTPIEDVSIRANRKNEGQQRFFFGNSKNDSTDASGAFRIEDLQEGEFDLRLRKQGFVTKTEEAIDVLPRRERSGIRITMDRGSWIRITVTGGKKGQRLRAAGLLPGEEKPRSRWFTLDEAGVGWVELGDLEGTGELTVSERGENPRTTTTPIMMKKGANAEVTVTFE